MERLTDQERWNRYGCWWALGTILFLIWLIHGMVVDGQF